MTKEKDSVRQKIWDLLNKENAARFPFPIEGRIPNFKGAKAAAEKLDELEIWQRAKVLKCNPDSPQAPVRKKALLQGKKIYMAVPKLREVKCFVELDPNRLDSDAKSKASSIKGAFKYGRQVSLDEMDKIDLVVAGSVAVTRDGARVGKGGGYSDLEFALGRENCLISEETAVITTVHPLQFTSDNWEITLHDIPVDFIVTPEEIIQTGHAYPKPKGIYWDILKEEIREKIPILRQGMN
ncbi:5-formyltetrahydrofolate cyclo-ligase [candidate division KSB1 bacterium]|nr:5-formyltetrahydrofolate cyclo-ligase [candidate division KSB1 bacterium]NIR69637.1 5-formyltetrahydrofolate cyclo-ligase [candidate division KSB1 bacterium]NIS25744.1 5-formyltetrahydrofolate cyclo-ligase [candidate division KSB1 bacterium]NIT72613.1 5-formyltetrahydrofolate cyclo-ligase [candidate division KSB1 bacterium]NIU26425.1 5-formyltetrahydrofolate cyclo-ligase [candidate division KSB1 bacterium]